MHSFPTSPPFTPSSYGNPTICPALCRWTQQTQFLLSSGDSFGSHCSPPPSPFPKAPQHNTQRAFHGKQSTVEYKNLTSYPAWLSMPLPTQCSLHMALRWEDSQEAPRNDSPNEGPSTFLCVDVFLFRPHAGDLFSIVRTAATTMAHGSLPPSLPHVCFPPFLLNNGTLSEGSLLIHPRSSAQTAIKKKKVFFLFIVSVCAAQDFTMSWNRLSFGMGSTMPGLSSLSPCHIYPDLG